jgi:hypothetical protein
MNVVQTIDGMMLNVEPLLPLKQEIDELSYYIDIDAVPDEPVLGPIRYAIWPNKWTFVNRLVKRLKTEQPQEFGWGEVA